MVLALSNMARRQFSTESWIGIRAVRATVGEHSPMHVVCEPQGQELIAGSHDLDDLFYTEIESAVDNVVISSESSDLKGRLDELERTLSERLGHRDALSDERTDGVHDDIRTALKEITEMQRNGLAVLADVRTSLIRWIVATGVLVIVAVLVPLRDAWQQVLWGGAILLSWRSW